MNPAARTALGALLALVLVLAALLALVMIGYARRRGLLDAPGQRRLHRLPTPRGGGAGVVAALLVGLPLLPAAGVAVPARWLLTWWPALLLTALLGARDDHGGLGIAPRLLGHLLAAGLVTAGLWPLLVAAWGPVLALAMLPLLVLAIAWSVNLHNFMDGSDGLLAMQVLVVALGMALLAARAHAGVPETLALLLAAAVAGFLPFNLPLPRARIFLGDVGSATLGLMVAALALAGAARAAWTLPAALLLVSAFAVDATATLLSRMLRGRRWWQPHREHLYQWLARAGRTHALPLLVYASWNVLLALPLALLAQRRPALGWWMASALYMLAGALWWLGKRACRRAPRRRRNRHAPA